MVPAKKRPDLEQFKYKTSQGPHYHRAGTYPPVAHFQYYHSPVSEGPQANASMTLLKGRALNWAITATAGSGFLLFGYDRGVMSGLLTGDAFTRTFPEIDTTNGANGSATLQGTVVAIYEIGCFFGAIFCLLVGERLGRRRCIMIGCVVLAVGAVLQAAAFGIPQMIVRRIVAGLGNGMNTSTIRRSSPYSYVECDNVNL